VITLGNVNTFHGVKKQVSIDRFPDSCPLCHFSLRPKYLEVAHFKEGEYRKLELLLQCPREECQSYFIARYFESRHDRALNRYFLGDCVPSEPVDKKFPKSIQNISPDFCLIADQAQKAERQGWKLVAGPGYRKALEFLIKDYLCRLRPGDADAIKRAQLGVCIRDHVADSRIKSMALRAVWLGNDETHYVRKWEDKDLDDMKNLIQLTLHWVEMEELTESAKRGMPEAKE
jgi:hypothetical protein